MRAILAVIVVLSASVTRADDRAGAGAFPPAQSAADYLREHTAADGAFLAAFLVKDTFQRDNLATILNFRTDEVMILSLSGTQIKQAFERSLSLYPASNTSFLQISGFEVIFSKSAPPNSRVVSVSVGSQGAKLEDARAYKVAMPSSLARGAFGYFKVWDRSHIVKTLEGVTMEDVLKGKKLTETNPRWLSPN